MFLSTFRKGMIFFLLLLSVNSYSDQQANVTVKLPFGAGFVSFVSYANDAVPADYWKILAVGSSTSQVLNVGDVILVDTLQDIDRHRCDYFQVVNAGDVTVKYTGLSWNPNYKLDKDGVLTIARRYYTYDFNSCDNPALIKNEFYKY